MLSLLILLSDTILAYTDDLVSETTVLMTIIEHLPCLQWEMSQSSKVEIWGKAMKYPVHHDFFVSCDHVTCSIMLARPLKPEVNICLPVYEVGYDIKWTMNFV